VVSSVLCPVSTLVLGLLSEHELLMIAVFDIFQKNVYCLLFQAVDDDEPEALFDDGRKRHSQRTIERMINAQNEKKDEAEWADVMAVVEAVDNAEAVGVLGPTPDAEAAIEVDSSLDDSVRSFRAALILRFSL